MPQEPTTPNRSSTSSEPNTPNNLGISKSGPPDIYATRKEKKRAIQEHAYEDTLVAPKILNHGQASSSNQLIFSAPFNPYTQIDATQQMPVSLEEDPNENTLQEITQHTQSNQNEVIGLTPPAIKRFRF